MLYAWASVYKRPLFLAPVSWESLKTLLHAGILFLKLELVQWPHAGKNSTGEHLKKPTTKARVKTTVYKYFLYLQFIILDFIGHRGNLTMFSR